MKYSSPGIPNDALPYPCAGIALNYAILHCSIASDPTRVSPREPKSQLSVRESRSRPFADEAGMNGIRIAVTIRIRIAEGSMNFDSTGGVDHPA
jgi:hypothetical protein